MKAIDDYTAKVRMWAERQIVVPLPPGPRIPRFRSKKFKTHAEMNRWKESLLLQIAREQAAHG